MDNGEQRCTFANNEAAMIAIACDSWEEQKSRWRKRGQEKSDLIQSCLCCTLELLSEGTLHSNKQLRTLVRAHLATQLAVPVNEYTVDNFDKLCDRRRK